MAAADTVAPVVSTSSTRATVRPATRASSGPGANASCTFLQRACREAGDLRRGVDGPGQRPAQRRPEGLGQQFRLVEAAFALAARMERHRHHQVDPGEEISGGVAHERPELAADGGAPAVLERVHHVGEGALERARPPARR